MNQEKKIAPNMSAAEALTVLAARLDAASGAAIVTAAEHSALITITESPDKATEYWRLLEKQKASEAARADALERDAADLRRKLSAARDEAARLGAELAELHAKGLDEIADKTHAGPAGGFVETSPEGLENVIRDLLNQHDTIERGPKMTIIEIRPLKGSRLRRPYVVRLWV